MPNAGSLSHALAFVAVVAVAFPGVALAQANASDKAAAEALFDQGIALMEGGRLVEACQKLEQSQAIERGIGTMLYLAECYEKSGRTASAWALFREAASAAQAEGQVDRARAGADRALRLEPRLSKLTIVVAGGNPVDSLQVFHNGQPVRRALWAIPVPVDPGNHRVEARAPGRLDWVETVNVDKDATTASITIPALGLAATGPVGAGQPTSPAPGVSLGASTPSPDAGASRRGSFQRTLGLVTLGVGVVGVGVGGVFGLNAISKNGDAEDRCPDPECADRKGVTLTDEARDSAKLANVFVIGGAVVAGAGVVLYLTAPRADGPRVAIQGGKDRASLVWGGAW